MILVGPVGLRQVDRAADDRRAGGHLRRRAAHRRRGGQRQGPEGPRHRDGVPELRALPAHDGAARTWASRSSWPRSTRRRSTRRSTRRPRSLDLDQHLDRKPANLSGGQRQRVAMGRAIVRDPAAFLMDEPLSNLDAKLRVQMRTEVSRIQQRLGTTTVYVTHDQTEAMTLGDRVAVMRAGVLQQVGSPMELYNDAQEPVRGRLHRLTGDELHARHPRGRHGSSCRWPTWRCPRCCARRGRRERRAADRRHPPEDFEDAALVGAATDQRHHVQGHDRRCWSRWARSCTPTSRSTSDAERSSPTSCASWPRTPAPARCPARGEEGQIVARLDPGSKATEGRSSSCGSTPPTSICSRPRAATA